MKRILSLLVVLFLSFAAHAQVDEETEMGYILKDSDTISDTEPIELPEVIIQQANLTPEEKKAFQLLQNRVYRVYPYAKIAAERLVLLNKNMAALKTNREKKKYFKIVENYMETEFEAQLKKLSRKQGQILVKLVHRQTGQTTYDLIKDLKSGWTAFWYNNTGKVFDIDIRRKYQPFQDNEDFLIETILERAFVRGRLVRQAPANPVDLDELTEYWEKKAAELAAKK
ncbi:DUF4294 domain-containing protein [Flavobacterium caeni]|uniref:DUF4294 domain-containing protein n=1 Tax=Flavobacterium caeni TaxID=490189 RepID=A0A1G5JVL1_9FLAO|nr:DUF4294 domain-containing protein [Flavobacterium caeni]SCY92405.1 protein of unknown function [Flavobacterium caeni]